jgi:membrane associated rhomboid family serine protease
VTRAVVLAAIALSLAAWLGIEPVWRLAGPGPLSEPWRLFTSALLHGGALHLVFNLLWVWQLGMVLELGLGPRKTLALFLVLTFVSSLAQQLFDNPGIGLSGLVYGLFGMLWVAKRRGLPIGLLLTDAITKAFVAWFFIAILLDHFGWMRIGNVAHAAGALAGCLAGLWLPRNARGPREPASPSYLSSRGGTRAPGPSSASPESDNPLHRSPEAPPRPPPDADR